MQCPDVDEESGGRLTDGSQWTQALISSAGTSRTLCERFKISTDEGIPRGLCVIGRWVTAGNKSRGGGGREGGERGRVEQTPGSKTHSLSINYIHTC